MISLSERHIGAWFGLFAAIGLVAYTAALYFGGLTTYLSGYAYFGYAISIGLAAVAGPVQRKANGGWLGFQAALRTSFMVVRGWQVRRGYRRRGTASVPSLRRCAPVTISPQ